MIRDIDEEYEQRMKELDAEVERVMSTWRWRAQYFGKLCLVALIVFVVEGLIILTAMKAFDLAVAYKI